MAEKGPWEEGGSAGPEPGHDRGPDEAPGSREEPGAVSGGGRPPRRGFNPGWLLVPAAGLLLGGMGIASMNRQPRTEPTPTVTVTGPAATVTRPVAPIGSATTAPGCDLGFVGTTMRAPVTRIQNDQTGQTLNAPPGQTFVIVDTTLANAGTDACYATPGYQRVYTKGDTYYTGNTEASRQLGAGRLVTQPIEAGARINGAYVFQIPSGSKVSSVRLRSNGSGQWTIVTAG